MEYRIDLDAAAAVLAERLASRPDLSSGPITWKGFESRFDEPFKTDRSDIVDPYSVGIQVRRGDEEGRLVLYAGGWADFEYWNGDASDAVVDRVPGWEDWLDVQRFDAVVVEFLSEFQPTPL